MHGNQVYDAILPGQKAEPLRWIATAGGEELDPGNRILARASDRTLLWHSFSLVHARWAGHFFLDEPVTHLDDLNRVGLLDIFRATAIESSGSMT